MIILFDVSYVMFTVSFVLQENTGTIKKKKKRQAVEEPAVKEEPEVKEEDVTTNGVEATPAKKKRKIKSVEAEPEVTEEAGATQVEKKKKKKKKVAEDE